MSVGIMTKVYSSHKIKLRKNDIDAGCNIIAIKQEFILNPKSIDDYMPTSRMVVCMKSVTQNKKKTRVKHQLN